MKEIIRNIPLSGVIFIFLSVMLFGFRAGNRQIPFFIILVAEAGLFWLCFFGVDQETRRRK